MSNTTENQITVNGLFQFHGLYLTVLEHHGVEYIPVKPISDLLEMLWKSTKRSLLSGDNPQLYGTTELEEPVFNELRTTSGTKKAVCIKLKQVYMFLARTNTNQLRTKGNVSGADYLLTLQKEWGEALYHYETHGAAYKKAKDERVGQLMSLFKLRNTTRNPKEQATLTALIQRQFAELGQPLEQEPDLFNS